MRIVMPGGSGQVGQFIARWLRGQGHTVQVLGRSEAEPALRWDARTLGPWVDALDGADAVIQLTGRTVNCRYTWANLRDMMNSRVDSALVVGEAIARVKRPPAVWLQASTATIYPHSLGDVYDETAAIGQSVPGVPAYWSYSVNIARSWELALMHADLPQTRRVAMRFGFAMSPDRGGVFDWLMWVVRQGLGGPFYGGDQYVSWVTDRDLAGAIGHMLTDERLQGPVNVTSPEPLLNRDFMGELRRAAGVRLGLPVLPGMAEAGAFMLGTDVELMRKSRRVVPAKLLDAGFAFQDREWGRAAPELVRRWRAGELLG